MPLLKKHLKTLTFLLLIHAFFAFYRLFPTLENFKPLTFLLPLGELGIVFLLLHKSGLRKISFSASLIILSFLVFFLVGELFFRIIYLEHFDIISDIRLIPELFVMLLQGSSLSTGFIQISSIVLTLIFTVSIAWGLLIIIEKSICNFSVLSNMKIRFVFSLSAFLLIIAPTGSPVSQTIRMIIDNKQSDHKKIQFIETSETKEITETSFEISEPEWSFPKIQDSDIHFVVIESYGSVLFQIHEYIDLMSEMYSEMQSLLDDAGMITRSGYVLSPAFGGRSWLADATLISGEQIVNQKIYDARISDGKTALFLDEMKHAGYTSYYVAPGTTQANDEWKAAYPFDTYILQDDFNYDGPFISFGYMSDQFMFYDFVENHLAEGKKQFAFYLLVSAHTPFTRIPVFKEDWDFSQNGREYENDFIEYFDNNWLHGNELAEGYLAGISYSLKTTVHYLTDKLTGKHFMLIIGDHQPRVPVSNHESGYPVVFHIIYPKENQLEFPESWKLSTGLVPPELPDDESELPTMSAMPHLILHLIK